MSDEKLRELAEVDRIIHEPARLLLSTILYSVKEADFLFLLNESGLTKGNLSSHLAKLEEAGYITVEKRFNGKKPQTLLRMTEAGRNAFRAYKKAMQQVLDDLPD